MVGFLNMKKWKKIIIIVAIIGISYLCFGGCVYFLTDKKIDRIDISNKEPLHVKIFSELTFNHNFSMTVFPYEEMFLYSEKHNHNHESEIKYIELLSIVYSDSYYSVVKNYIKDLIGYDDSVNWSYQNYNFVLNSTEVLMNGNNKCNTSFELSNDTKTIKWINCVAFNDINLTIRFIGYKYNFHGLGYEFKTWNDLFSSQYSFCSWE